MYDLNSQFNDFYKNYVMLPEEEKNRLRELKKLNIDRLKDGLSEYNEENETSYKLVEVLEQGSVAMGTVNQNDENDYDIDVAIVFDKDNIPEGNISVKNIIVDALKRKCTKLKKDPEFKTNCVRIIYSEGYHIDFAIYRRFKNDSDEYEYEHCGSEWRSRDPRAITNWFLEKNKDNNYNLREIVRIIKMFSKSRTWWKMPGGLIQSVLVEEQIQENDRLDVAFYNTIDAIKTRLFFRKNVYNPVDSSNLILKQKDRTEINNLYNRLSTHIENLSILFDDECSKNDALEAWGEFFNHSYWNNLLSESDQSILKSASASYDYDETEEFIEQLFPVDINTRYNLKINCKVTQDGWRTDLLRNLLRKGMFLRRKKDLCFYIEENTVPQPYQVYWKIRNCGDLAKQRNCIRGQILKDEGKEQRIEKTSFRGAHYVECYIVKNKVCVARDRIDVPISNSR